MTDSILDEKFTLQDLLDTAILNEIMQAYSQCFSLGVAIVSDEGEDMISVCPDHNFCLEAGKGTSNDRCAGVIKRIKRHPLDGSQVLQIRSFCGMNYSLFPLTHQLEVLGRVIVGPFRDSKTAPEAILSMAGFDSKNPELLKKAERIPAISQERIKQLLKLLTKVLDGFLFINAKRLITTRLHLDSIFDNREKIFRQVELQNSGTSQDKEEIEKLKDLF